MMRKPTVNKESRIQREELAVRMATRVSAPYYLDLCTPLVGKSTTTVEFNSCMYSLNVGRVKLCKELLGCLDALDLGRYPVLYDLEHSELSKVGPKSWIPCVPWWRDGLEPYFKSLHTSWDGAALLRAQEKVWQLIGSKFQAGRFSEMRGVTFPKSTFSGMPWLTKTSEVESDVIAEAIEQFEELKSSGHLRYYYPSVLGHRGQSKGNSAMSKARVVWQYPKSSVVVGLSWFKSVQPQLSLIPNWFVGWRPQVDIDRAICDILNLAISSRVPVYSLDFTQFDATISPKLVQYYFERCEEVNVPLIGLLEDFFSSKIITPDGISSSRDHGVPSGHAWTNLVDSLANMTCLFYVAERAKVHVLTGSVLGDDSVVVFSKRIPMEDLVGFASELGMKINGEKTVVSHQKAHFLQRIYWQGSNVGVRSLVRTLGSMISLERFEPEMSVYYNEARWWMQLAEVHTHPFRRVLLDLVKSRDSYGLMVGEETKIREEIATTNLKDKNAWRMLKDPSSLSFWFLSPD